jgi:alkanesulfonate monooxygenase
MGSATPDEQRCYGCDSLHDERYQRSDEFLTICRAWRRDGPVEFAGRHYRVEGGTGTPFLAADRTAPEISGGGGSAPA